MINKIFNFQNLSPRQIPVLRPSKAKTFAFDSIFNTEQRGITLLLVVILLTAIMSISLGLFNLVFGEIFITGELTNSFLAFYAVDQAIDKALYLNRIEKVICKIPAGDPNGAYDNITDPCYKIIDEPLGGACYTTTVSRTPSGGGLGTIDVVTDSYAEYRCGGGLRSVRRRFQILYTDPTECNDNKDNNDPDTLIDFIPDPPGGGDPQCLSIDDLSED